MSIDFSILNNIDFANTDTILFLSIFIIIAIIILLVFFVIIAKIIKFIKRSVVSVFNIDVKQTKSGQKESAGWSQQSQDNKEVSSLPKQNFFGGDSTANFNAGKKDSEKEKKETVESYKEKEEKSISDSLGKLKVGNSVKEDTLESKMPSRQREGAADDNVEIKIPRAERFLEEEKEETVESGADNKTIQMSKLSAGEIPVVGKKQEAHLIEKLKSSLTNESSEKDKGIEKRLQESRKFTESSFVRWVKKVSSRKKIEKGKKEGEDNQGVVLSSGLHGSQLTYEKEKIEAAKRTLHGRNKGLIEKIFGRKESKIDPAADILKNPQTGEVPSTLQVEKEKSIFGGETGVPRRTLKREMIVDSEIKKAARLTKLGLSPAERADLVKEVFPKVYGGNISKTDLKRSVKKLGKQMRGTNPSSSEHKVLRKEVKFFKKIGGIK